jgi:hypothetical protein
MKTKPEVRRLVPSAATLAIWPVLAQVVITNAPASDTIGCTDCLAMGGQTWVHLNMCRECGHVGCCNNSPNMHSIKHYHATRHRVIQRFEPGEDWGFDWKTGTMIEPMPPELATSERHLDWDKGYVQSSPKHKHPSKGQEYDASA